MLAFLSLGLAGLLESDNGSAALIFLQYIAQLVAGFVAGRLAAASRILNGSFAAATLFVITSGVSVAGGGGLGLFVLVAFAAVSLVIGAAGGALAEWQADRAGGRTAGG